MSKVSLFFLIAGEMCLRFLIKLSKQYYVCLIVFKVWIHSGSSYIFFVTDWFFRTSHIFSMSETGSEKFIHEEKCCLSTVLDIR